MRAPQLSNTGDSIRLATRTLWILILSANLQLSQAVLPSIVGFYEWTSSSGSSQNDWNSSSNWSGPIGIPNAVVDGAYFGSADANLDGRAIELNGSRTVKALVVDNDASFSINENTLIFETLLSATSHLAVDGSASLTINSNLAFYDYTIFSNDSTGLVTVNGSMNLGDILNSPITFTGSGRTVINGNIFDALDEGIVNVDMTGTLELYGANTFSDGFILDNGNVLVGNDSALGNDYIIFNGGRVAAINADRSLNETYYMDGDFTIGNHDGSDFTLTGSGNLNSDLSTTVESGITAFLTGNISGSHAWTKEGAGTLDLTGSSSFNHLIVNNGLTTSTLTGDLTMGGTGPGSTPFGDGDVTINANGSLHAETSSNLKIGHGSTMTNAGAVDLSADGAFNIAGNVTQTAGTMTADIGGDIITSNAINVDVSGGEVDFVGGGDFTTGNDGASLTFSNGATGSIDLTTGATASVFTLGEFDYLTVDGSGTALNIATESDGLVLLRGEINVTNNGEIIVTQGPVTFDHCATFDGGLAATAGTLEVRDDLTFDNDMTIANGPNVTMNIASGDTANITASAPGADISGLGAITKSGDGSVVVNANLTNLAGGKILINGGELLSSVDHQLGNNMAMEFADNLVGDTTPTWIVNDVSESLGTLTLSNNSLVSLDLGADTGDGGIVSFADSSAIDWTGSGALIISHWAGDVEGGGLDQVYIGANINGATNTQVQRIFFQNPVGLNAGLYAAIQLPTGEIVPSIVPEPSTYITGGGLTLGIGFMILHKRLRSRSKDETSKTA